MCKRVVFVYACARARARVCVTEIKRVEVGRCVFLYNGEFGSEGGKGTWKKLWHELQSSFTWDITHGGTLFHGKGWRSLNSLPLARSRWKCSTGRERAVSKRFRRNGLRIWNQIFYSSVMNYKTWRDPTNFKMETPDKDSRLFQWNEPGFWRRIGATSSLSDSTFP